MGDADAPRGDLGSVPVWRLPSPSIEYRDGFIADPGDAREALPNAEPGRWRPLDTDDALLLLIGAARNSSGAAFPVTAGDVYLRDALERLALLDGKATS